MGGEKSARQRMCFIQQHNYIDKQQVDQRENKVEKSRARRETMIKKINGNFTLSTIR